MRTCTRIDVKWMLECQPEYFDTIKLFETRKEFERAKT